MTSLQTWCPWNSWVLVYFQKRRTCTFQKQEKTWTKLLPDCGLHWDFVNSNAEKRENVSPEGQGVLSCLIGNQLTLQPATRPRGGGVWMRDTHIGCMRSLPCWAVLLQITGVELALFACPKRFSEGSAGEGGLCAAPLCVHGKLAVVLEATTPLQPE